MSITGHDDQAHPVRRSAWSPRVLAALLAVPLGLLGSGALVWQASYAAFTAQTVNPANSWTTGSVALSDDDGGAAMFSQSAVKPGSSGQKCITVTYNGSITSGVRLFIATGGLTGSTPLASALTLVVEEGSGSSFGASPDCTGFTATGGPLYSGTLNGFATTRTQYSNGVSAWAPTGAAQTRTFRFAWTLPTSADNTVQNLSTTATFTWEAQNT